MAVRVKICGITSVADALVAVEQGADALGLVFYPPSSRNVGVDTAKTIVAALPPFVQSVALFVNPSKDDVQAVLEAMPIDLIQFHGNETAEFCQQFQRPYIKAFAMRDDLDLDQAMAEHPQARGFLLDAYHPEKPGGTGEKFDWSRFPKNTNKAMVLAGGLTAENVAEAIAQCAPYAVDVSGGVEAALGKKSVEKIIHFIQQAKNVVQGKSSE